MEMYLVLIKIYVSLLLYHVKGCGRI